MSEKHRASCVCWYCLTDKGIITEQSATSPDRPSVRAQETPLELFAQQARCQHEKREGGNDYILCPDCHLVWDYRRETCDERMMRNLLSALRETNFVAPRKWCGKTANDGTAVRSQETLRERLHRAVVRWRERAATASRDAEPGFSSEAEILDNCADDVESLLGEADRPSPSSAE